MVYKSFLLGTVARSGWRRFVTAGGAMLCAAVVLFHCTPRAVRPVIETGSRDFYLDYRVAPVAGNDTTVRVILDLPAQGPPCDRFCFPLQVPGQYDTHCYGKYVRDLVMSGPDGDTLDYRFVDTACFVLDTLSCVRRIVYDLPHSYGAKADSLPLFAGTYFSSTVWLLNSYAAFGFFPKLIDKPVRIRLTVPEEWTLGTSLVMDSAGALYADNYQHLQDSPILAGLLSRRVLSHNDRNYFIYRYNEGPRISIWRLRRKVRAAVKDVDHFVEGFPSRNYSLLFVFADDELPGFGAHEHAHSSVYSMGVPRDRKMVRSMDWVIRHELFHTVVPLSLQSTEIHDLDYLEPRAVSHLWFYEGLTQWATFKMQLNNGTLDSRRYLALVGNMLRLQDTKEDSLSLVTLSRKALNNRRILPDIYRRGMVFGAVLDIYIVAKTRGRTTLREVVLTMKNRYPPGTAFAADSIFDIIASLSHPSVKEFCTDYLVENRRRSLLKAFADIGIDYEVRQTHPQVKAGFGFIPASRKKPLPIVVGGVYKEAKGFGYEPGDTLVRINGRELDEYSLPSIVRPLLTSSPGKSYTAVVLRDGKRETVVAQTVRYYRRHVIEIDQNADTSARELREVWEER